MKSYPSLQRSKNRPVAGSLVYEKNYCYFIEMTKLEFKARVVFYVYLI